MKNLLFVLLLVGGLYAADQSENRVPSSPLTIYSGGLTIGSLVALNPQLKDMSNQFLTVSFSNTFHIRDRIDLFLDVEWFGPGANFCTEMGADFYLTKFQFRPFYGLGAGVVYLNRAGDNVGPAATMHIGFELDISEKVQMRFKIPYHVVANQSRDQAVGLDMGLLFSKGYKKVKKLEYNR